MSTHFSIILPMLLAASMMWPSEGAINGSGLHLAVLWLVAGVVAVWTPCTNRSRRFSAHGSPGWGLLIAGLWISTYFVFQAEGDRRAAVNLGFEWISVGVVWWLVSRLAAKAASRQWIILVVTGLCFGASLQGIVQHHVTYAQQAEWYRQGRGTLDAASIDGDMQKVIDARKVAAEFQAMDIPLTGAGRELFERRLLSSSEPVGPFALANTLAGVLASSLVILVGSGLLEVQRAERFPWLKLIRLIPFLITIAYCLVLTKSRTAWVASGLGVAVLLFGGGLSSRLLSRLVPGAAVLVMAVVGAGIGTGALDKEVVLESPRSLQFRLLYWMGAAGVIREKPIFGAGPGNFRQTYLAHKPVESSEEILDPHNIFLDAWCSAGVVGFVGVCLVGWQFVSGTFSKTQDDLSTSDTNTSRPAMFRQMKGTIAGIVAAAFLHLLWRWGNGGSFWDSTASGFAMSQNILLLVPLGAIVAFVILNGSLSLSRKVVAAAGVTLFVHLMGAGGLQITVVGTVLAVLSGCLCTGKNVGVERVERFESGSQTVLRAGGTCFLGACICIVVMFGLIPVLTAEHYLGRSQALENRGNFAAAGAPLQLGLDSDPLSTTLRQRRVELLTYQLAESLLAHARSEDSLEFSADELFGSVLDAADDLIAADRRNWRGYVARSQARKMVAEAGVKPEQGDLAVDDLCQATEFYPTNAELWVMLAELSSRFGREELTRSAAARALVIDNSNREWGHIDRFLNDDQLQLLTKWK